MICGLQVPNSNSCTVPAADPPLFQRRIDRRETVDEGRAEAIDGGDDHEADANRDQAILNRGRARQVTEEFWKDMARSKLRPWFRRLLQRPGRKIERIGYQRIG